MKITCVSILLLSLLAGQVALGQNVGLQGYVQAGFENNLALRQKEFDLERSQLALRESKRLFYPNMDLGATYTLAGGGRTIAIPVGDLVNPIYQTLNQLTQSNQFPMVENQETKFLPNNFLDARVRTAMPLLNPDIRLGQSIKADQVALQADGIALYKRDLAAQIKTAYLDWLAAGEAVRIYENALALLRENLRVNEALLRNDQINRSPVLEAESRLRETEADLVGARNQVAVAAAYFNFLLNRPLDSPLELLELGSPDSLLAQQLLPLDPASAEEMHQLNTALGLSAKQLQLEKNWNKPRLNSFLDLGAQGYVTGLDKHAPYFLLGAQLEWNLFDFGKNSLRQQQAELGTQQLAVQKTEVQRQLELREFSARQSLAAALEVYRASDASLVSAREYYRTAEKTWRNDQANYLQLTDARTRLTTASLRRSLDKFEVLKKLVAYERATYRSLL